MSEQVKYFVPEDSIVRKIWGSADNILFIFAGSAAEFALNKAVDWLYFTGKLPADPLGRLFSTVEYGRMIIFAPYERAIAAIDRMSAIHQSVENARGAQIPDWAYRDVLFMLIDYSVRSFELLQRPLTADEKEDVFNVFYRMGLRMGLKGLPHNYLQWEQARVTHLQEHLVKSEFTVDLFRQYKKHLGWFRYQILKQVQLMLAPPQAKSLLHINKFIYMRPVLALYKFCRLFKGDRTVKQALLPAQYKAQLLAMDIV